jgi:hypothetical protein
VHLFFAGEKNMKIRNGFVSNSSSSSFVVFGFKANDVLPKSEEERRKFIEENGKGYILECLKNHGVESTWYDFLYGNNPFGIDNISFLSNAGDGFIGYVISDARLGEDELDEQELSLDELLIATEKLRQKFNIKEKPKIYTGTRTS